jgi:hypothetical protein
MRISEGPGSEGTGVGGRDDSPREAMSIEHKNEADGLFQRPAGGAPGYSEYSYVTSNSVWMS